MLTKTLTEVQGKCSALSKNIFNSIPVDLVSMNFGLHKAYDHNQVTNIKTYIYIVFLIYTIYLYIYINSEQARPGNVYIY